MPTLGEVHDTVSRWLRRGNVFDVDVPGAVRMAARSIERNYTLKYMEQYVSFVIPSVAIEPRAINFPDTKVKRIRSIKIIGADGEARDLTSMDPLDFKFAPLGEPRRYWLDGMDYIWFDHVPDVDYPAEMVYDRYTTWPVGANIEDVVNWLTENADDMLVAHALNHLKIVARLPPDIREEITSFILRAEGELIRADEELRFANTSEVMAYGRVY